MFNFGNWLGSKKSEEKPQEKPSTEQATIKTAVAGTRQSLVGKIAGLVSGLSGGKPLDDETIDSIEETLIRADVGLSTATDITDKLREQRQKLKSTADVMVFLKNEFSEILSPVASENTLKFIPGAMNIYLVVGVNGAGKTTFIGKLANRFVKAGKQVIIGAGDTFRAAAEEQLEIWAQRSGAVFVGAQANNTDPAAVMFDAMKIAKEKNAEVVLLDTAGRLQNKFNLMEELRKIRRVIDKEMPEGANFEVLLVLDATTGQNALRQAEVFKEAVNLSGVVLTKLDGSAKGGVILSVAKEYGLPVKMVGVGEGIDDLKDFDTAEFMEGLFAGSSIQNGEPAHV